MFRGILQIRVHDMAELVEQGLPLLDTELVVAVALVAWEPVMLAGVVPVVVAVATQEAKVEPVAG